MALWYTFKCRKTIRGVRKSGLTVRRRRDDYYHRMQDYHKPAIVQQRIQLSSANSEDQRIRFSFELLTYLSQRKRYCFESMSSSDADISRVLSAPNADDHGVECFCLKALGSLLSICKSRGSNICLRNLGVLITTIGQ
jgi:hypothetical protein